MNHDNEYHDDVNYGNRFPDGWYMNTWELQSYHAQQIKEYRDQTNTNKSQDEYKKCYKPHRTIHNY